MLVLMAVAAGVVIVAITNNAQDDLEAQQTDIGAKCEPWEIYDATLAANGRGGGNGGVGSSAEGCLRVCYLRHERNATIDAGDHIVPPGTSTDGWERLDFVMSRTNIATATSAGSHKTAVVVTGNDTLALSNDDENPTAFTHRLSALEVDSNGGTDQTDAVDFDDDNMIIKVATNQEYCHIWNNTTNEEIIRSSRE